jgi:hypothetical protein
MKKLMTIALLVATFAACKKHTPTITVESPTNRSYVSGELIPITIKFSSEGEIEDIEVYVENLSNNNDKVFEVKRHLHRKSFDMNGEFTPQVTTESRMKLVAKTKDHDDKVSASREVEFTVTP